MNKIESLQVLGLSKAVFLPIPKGVKGPHLLGWQKKTLADMADPAYLRQFEGDGNVGVLLGKPSADICTIDVDSDEDYAAFLTCNPDLTGSLQTKGARGGNVWVKIVGDYPALSKIIRGDGTAWGEFRSDGGQTVIQGKHPSGVDYTMVVKAEPVLIEFEKIRWPEGVVLPWLRSDYDALVEAEGAPFQYGKDNKLTFNEPAIAAKFAVENPVLFEADEQAFYEYDVESGLWKVRSDSIIRNQFSRSLKQAADDLGDPRILTVRTALRLNSLLSLLKGQVGVKGAFDVKTPRIHCLNGVLNLGVHPPTFSTFGAEPRSRNASPVAYDPNATCPCFLNDLLAQALDADDISLLQRVGGAMLLGRNVAQRFLLLMGTAGGGKSTLVSIIERVIGTENVAQLRTEHLDGRFESHAYRGKTLLTGKDVQSDFLQQRGAHKIKSLVGGDFIQAEKKGSDHFAMRGEFNMVITCNSNLKIRLEGDMEAWERRALVIHYEKPKPAMRIPDFDQKLLREEGAGILNFFIEGAWAHLEELQERGDFTLTHAQVDRVRCMMRESDSIRQFVQGEVARFEGGDVTSQELATAYFAYCERQGWSSYTAMEVYKKLPGIVLELHHVNLRHDIVRDGRALRGYQGLILAQEGK